MRQLLDLPLELVLHTITFLPSPADQQCLRLSCRLLYNLIPSLSEQTTTTKTTTIPEKYTFQSRLFKPGNIFYDLRHQFGLCSQCLLILDRKSNFSEKGKLKINGKEVCLDCVIEGCSDRYTGSDDGEEYFTCWECGELFPERMEAVDKEGGEVVGRWNDGVYNTVCRNCYSAEDESDEDEPEEDEEEDEESEDDEEFEDYYEDDDAGGEEKDETVDGADVIDLTSP